MPGASAATRRITIVNANRVPAADGDDGQFELLSSPTTTDNTSSSRARRR